MSLPVGHATIGFTAHYLYHAKESSVCTWKVLLGILVLSNLPDIDVLLGIVFYGNGNVFHRGPTHSLIFAIIGGFLASRVWKLWSQLPRFDFRISFLLILSHLGADFLFTSSAISFFWPITVNWTNGYSGLREVLSLVLFGNYQDAEIIIGSALVIILHRTLLGLGLLKTGQDLRSMQDFEPDN